MSSGPASEMPTYFTLPSSTSACGHMVKVGEAQHTQRNTQHDAQHSTQQDLAIMRDLPATLVAVAAGCCITVEPDKHGNPALHRRPEGRRDNMCQ